MDPQVIGNYYQRSFVNQNILFVNYNKYFSEGTNIAPTLDDYHSHNTRRLNELELTNLLEKIGYKA